MNEKNCVSCGDDIYNCTWVQFRLIPNSEWRIAYSAEPAPARALLGKYYESAPPSEQRQKRLLDITEADRANDARAWLRLEWVEKKLLIKQW